MMRTVQANLPLKLEGSKNTRDMGGYPTVADGNTAAGQFLRSDNPNKLTEVDVERLYDYGVRLVIDFRSEGEAQDAFLLRDYKDVAYINPQMIDNIHSGVDCEAPQMAVPPTLGELYIDFLDNKRHVYLDVFKTILDNHMNDCVFFNCTAGKDRTGVFAMILLKAAGAADDVIVADYKVSGDNIKEEMDALIAKYKEQGVTIDEDMVRSDPKHMKRALAHLADTYGTIEEWLTLTGLTADEIAKLKNKVLGAY